MENERLQFSVCYGDPQLLAARGYGLVADLPFILDARPAYHRLGSRYLIDRGLGRWHPYTRGTRELEPPAPQTIHNYAHWLANFLEWADVRGVDIYTCSYHEHVSGQYKTEMVAGLWSNDGRSLGAATINPRLLQAGDFLTWLCDKGYREAFFEVPTELKRIQIGKATDSYGYRSKQISAREGMMPKGDGKKHRMQYPSHEAVGEWLERVEARFGYVYRLMCETVCLTAVRRAEVVGWRADTLPRDKSEWSSLIANPDTAYEHQTIKAAIIYGAKGKSYEGKGRDGNIVKLDHGDKIGPRGTIHVPLPLADNLYRYLTEPKLRPAALESLKQRLREKGLSRKAVLDQVADTLHLFLDPETGERIDDRQLYAAWTGVTLPAKGWSPHRGRDWWACSVLMREISYLKEPGLHLPMNTVKTAVMDVIELQIRPQLRHANSQTSMIYLHWAVDRITSGMAIQYERAYDERNPVAGNKSLE